MGAMLFICSFLSINLARYLMVAIIGEILNFYRFSNKITSSFKNVIWFSGFRGAMGYILFSFKFNKSFFSICPRNTKLNDIHRK